MVLKSKKLNLEAGRRSNGFLGFSKTSSAFSSFFSSFFLGYSFFLGAYSFFFCSAYFGA